MLSPWFVQFSRCFGELLQLSGILRLPRHDVLGQCPQPNSAHQRVLPGSHRQRINLGAQGGSGQGIGGGTGT